MIASFASLYMASVTFSLEILKVFSFVVQNIVPIKAIVTPMPELGYEGI